MEGRRQACRICSLPSPSLWNLESKGAYSPDWSLREMPARRKPLQNLLGGRWANLPAKEMQLLVWIDKEKQKGCLSYDAQALVSAQAAMSSHSSDEQPCSYSSSGVGGSSLQDGSQPIPLGLHVPPPHTKVQTR